MDEKTVANATAEARKTEGASCTALLNPNPTEHTRRRAGRHAESETDIETLQISLTIEQKDSSYSDKIGTGITEQF
jgi:hypothetical protein